MEGSFREIYLRKYGFARIRTPRRTFNCPQFPYSAVLMPETEAENRP